jgi:hypothetical protein
VISAEREERRLRRARALIEISARRELMPQFRPTSKKNAPKK